MLSLRTANTLTRTQIRGRLPRPVHPPWSTLHRGVLHEARSWHTYAHVTTLAPRQLKCARLHWWKEAPQSTVWFVT